MAVNSDNQRSDLPPAPSSDNEATRQSRRVPRCGWCCWRPDFLQVGYKWPLGLALMCWFSLLQGFIVHGITPVNSSSLERRFRLSSIEVGWLNSVLDLSAAASTILFSYLADRAHRPRWLMFSASLFAVGCVLMSIPHYAADPYDGNGKGTSNLCHVGNATTKTTSFHRLTDESAECSGIKVSSWLNLLIAGNVIIGIGAGIIFTVGIAFIDDFSTKAASPLHIGIMYLFAAGGAAAGFAGGSGMLQLDVNFNRPDWPQFKGNKDFNPNYVGAWWLGYVIGAAGFGTVAIAFSCFDFELPETATLRVEKNSETHNVKIAIASNKAGRLKIINILLKFVERILKLFANPVLVCVTISAITHGLMADGIQPFFVKILRTQYVINEAKAGLAIAVIIVVAIGSGSIVSGIVLRRANLGLRGLILVVLTCVTTATWLGFGFFTRCSQEKISGITIAYDSFNYYDTIPKYDPKNLVSRCNEQCGCNADFYQPICHPKLGIQFFSPCHAACRVQRSVIKQGRNISIYAGCDCLAPLFFEEQKLTTVQQALFMAALQSTLINSGNDASINVVTPQQAYLRSAYQNFSTANVLASGACDTSCAEFYGGMIILFFILFIGYFTVVPLSNIVMRCVPEEDRSLALAFYQSMQRFIGSIPGPIMMGSVIDRVCLFRDPNVCPDDEGACFSYNTAELSRWLVGIFMGLHAVAVTCYTLAFLLYKPPNGETLHQFCCDRWSKKSRRSKENEDQIHDNPAYMLENNCEIVDDSNTSHTNTL